MAKSLRSKAKRQFRAKKRSEGIYAATEAARLHRLHMKLKALTTASPAEEEQEIVEEDEIEEGAQMETEGGAAASAGCTAKRISTHGPRNSRREQWRLSKGLPARPKAKGVNRQGGPAARRKAGRSHRRR
ncbi:hypothetical protein BD414DRAFT_404405 [Trametes punicea]|nr:hypothetical protein BD414DRAFT_404405 [Trametes punicea]